MRTSPGSPAPGTYWRSLRAIVQASSPRSTTSWGSAVTFACASGATIRYTRLKANPLATANDMVLAVVDDPSYNLSTCYWSGSAWANQLTHGVIAQVNFRSFDFAWEASGSKGLLVMSTAPNNLAYRTFTAPNTWGTITTVATGSTDHTWIQTRTNPVSGSTIKILGAASENTAQSLGGFKWDGTTHEVGRHGGGRHGGDGGGERHLSLSRDNVGRERRFVGRL